ncbi:MAG: hypothetical protein ACR2KE_01735, partial [Candidatus Nanopelagicales bacterium]
MSLASWGAIDSLQGGRVLRGKTIALIASAALLAGCGSSLSMAMGPSSAFPTPSDSAVTPAPTPTDTTPPPPPQVDSLRFVVQGKGELQDGKALTPGSRVKVEDLESGSLVQLLEVRDAGSPVVSEETTSSDASWRTSPLAPSRDFQLSVQAPDGSERVILFRTRGAGDRTTATIFPDKGT